MTSEQNGRTEGAAPAAPSGADETTGPVIRDNRVVDPVTGEPRRRDTGAGAGETGPARPEPDASQEAAAEAGPSSGAQVPGEPVNVVDSELGAVQALAEERLVDLQRLNAEYVNYRKRVERDRAVDYARGVSDVVDALIPVLDDLHAARQHGELGGPFASIAEKLEVVLEQRFGVERYGTAGEAFDPAVHEALMHATSHAVEETSVSQVLQPGYRVGERVLRAARVAVVGPE